MILLIIKLLLAQVKQMTHQKQMQQINRPRLSVSLDFSFHKVLKLTLIFLYSLDLHTAFIEDATSSLCHFYTN